MPDITTRTRLKQRTVGTLAILLTLTAIFFTLYLGRKPRPKKPYLKLVDSAGISGMFHRMDSVKKIVVDSAFKAQPTDLVYIPVP